MSRWLQAAGLLPPDKTDRTDFTPEAGADVEVLSVKSVLSRGGKAISRPAPVAPPKPTIPAGFVVFSTGDCPEGRAEARAWMHEKGLTREDVAGRIMGGQCCLVALRPLWIAP